METSPLNRDALVVYKNRPARVRDNDKKLELELDGGESVKVRPKDVQFLHPGPVRQLPPPRPTDGDILSAWELLAGEITTLPELADLAYGTYTPATAWAIWELLADGLHFSGTPEAIVAHSATVVAEKATVREAKAATERAWHAFLHRLEQGHYDPSDRSYLEDVEALALEKREQSRILRALNRVETPQNAHALLLSIGYWKATTNPYPTRLGIPLTPPNLTLPPLPEEPRRDLTHLEAWAIDDEGSQDPDDALSWDGERLWVHIADAAALVTPTSPADQEARGRAFNLYLPDGTIPMLPPDATHRLALGLNEVSPALSFALQVNATGEVTLQEMAISWVRVQRISYEEAQNRLDQSPFREMVTYIQPFHARRLRQGAIEIDLPEVRIRVKEGQVVIRRLLNLPSRDLVREAMLMTGEAVARYAQERHISLPFATQDPPDEDAPLAAATPSAYFALRRSLKRGQPKIAAAPHAGLGLTQYVQTTSPLRRYLDTVVHQQLRAHLTGQPLLNEQAILERIGSADAVSGTMRQAERLSNQHWTLVYLQQNPDWQGEGVIIEKRGSRDLVLFPDLAWESELYLKKDLPLDTYLTFTCTGLNLPEREAFFRLR